jgi:lipoprotein-anchoring transpeptidase ErfK/SrfK
MRKASSCITALLLLLFSTTGGAQEQSIVRAQVLLDRARFSPGPIDAHLGSNTEKALSAFQDAAELTVTGALDPQTWEALEARTGRKGSTLIDYQITKADTQGPFAKKLPGKLKEMAKLKRLAYRNPAELLAEKFHMDIGFLRRLNAGKRLDRVGSRIRIANVTRANQLTAARIEVDKNVGALRVYDKNDRIIAFYPATIGSEETPSPTGKVKVKGVAKNPTYRYDPRKLKFKDIKTKRPFTIAPGPNNPVGAVWIELTKDGYGIHGSPRPSSISREQSHGCVRLTNWDALDLAAMVTPGLEVLFVDSANPGSGIHSSAVKDISPSSSSGAASPRPHAQR